MKTSKQKRAITLIALLLAAVIAVVAWLTVAGVKGANPLCLFKHNYADGVCTRCGAEQPADKPAEDTPEPEQPAAFVSEPYRMNTASARPLMASAAAYSSYSFTSKGDVPTANVTTVDSLNYNDFTYRNYLTDKIVVNQTINSSQQTKFSVSANQSLKLSLIYMEDSEYGNFLYVKKQGNSNWLRINTGSDLETGSQSAFCAYEYTISEYGIYNVFCTTQHFDPDDDTTYCSSLLTIEYGVQNLPANPSKTGYTFTGWYTDEACTNKYTASTVTADITLYAGFRAHTYSVKFNANSGSGTMINETMTYDQAKNLTTSSFTKDHYAFKGWATSANGAVAYTDKQSVKNLTATDGAVIELFAIWERSEVSVTFVSEGSTVATTWIAIGTKATLPSNPTKDGHTFVGWYMADGTKYETQNISEDITLTARFEIIRCTVTFIVDGEVYAVYVCDWGTSLADALNANDVNPALLETEDEYSSNF